MSKVKKTEHDLRLKNEELNSFIYRVSHDIKGPLSSILGLIYLAKSEAEDVAAVNDYIKLIEQSANRLDNIIADFLELGRLTQSQVRTSSVQIDTLIQEIIKSNQFSPEYAKVQFKIRTDAPGTVKTKVILLKAILQNLIENAVRYRKTNTEAVIQIDVNYVDKDVVIKVSDNGIGMDKNVIEHIFKMFYRGNETSKGSGLGLYIVKTSIDALKGSIDVKSKPGQGSTFTITIPQRGKK
jgi:signal transduction histidine kinase